MIPKNSPYKFTTKNPPASAFTRYTKGDTSAAFAIANSVGKNGVPAKLFVKKAIALTFDRKTERKRLAGMLASDISKYLQVKVNNQSWQ